MRKKLISPLSGRILLKNPVANGLLHFIDFILQFCVIPKPSSLLQNPHRILICNIAHLGDAVLATSVLPALKSAFPQVSLGMLVGGWSKNVVTDHPLLDHVHHLDHWKLNREDISFWNKMVRHRTTFGKALQEIRKINYDIAIDLYPYFPNSIPLIYRAKIPCRIGYTSGGFGALLTHRKEWKDLDQSVCFYHFDLLKEIGVPESTRALLKVLLKKDEVGRVDGLRQKWGIPQEYVVIHMGTGAFPKEWPASHWKKLIARLTEEQRIFCLLTGKGCREMSLSEAVQQELPSVLNLCNKLEWDELTAIIQGASCLVGVDSVAGHVAAATGTPSVLIYSGISSLIHWKPLSEDCHVLTHQMPCAPCFRKTGCETMACVRQVNVDAVYHKVVSLIQKE